MATSIDILINAQDKASSVIDGVASKGSSALGGLTKAALIAGAAAATAAVGVGVAAIKLASDFETGMANVNSLIGPGSESDARIAALADSVKKTSVATGKSLDDLTGGLYQVISAFGDTADSAKILDIAARASTAGLATTQDAVNLLSAVTKGYGDTSAEAVQHASDLAFVTVKLGQTTFPELAASMGKVVPVAASLGVKQEELYASFATLTGVTGNTAEVATQLQNVFKAMLNPSADLAQRIHDLGYSSGGAMVEALGLQGSLNLLRDSTKGNDADFAALMGTTEAFTAGLALTGSQSDEFTAKLDAMKGAVGSTDEAFQIQQATVESTMARIGAALNVAMVDLGSKFLPVVQYVLDWVMTNWPTISGMFDRVMSRVGDALSYVVTNVLPPFVAALRWVIDNVLPALQGAFDTFSNKVMPTFKGVFDVLTGQVIPAFGGAFDTLTNSTIPGFVGVISDLLNRVVPWIASGFGAITSDVVPALAGAFDDLANGAIPLIGDAIGDMVSTAVPVLVDAFRTITDDVLPLVESAINVFVADTVPLIVDGFNIIATDAVPAVVDALSGIAQDTIPTVISAFDWITTDVVPKFAGAFMGIVQDVMPSVQDIFNTISTNVAPALQGALKSVTDWFSANWPTISSIAQSVGAIFKAQFEVIAGVVRFIVPILGTVSSVAFPVIGTAAGLMLKVVDFNFKLMVAVIQFFQGVVQTVASVVSGVWSGMRTQASTTFGAIAGAIRSTMNSVISAINSFIRTWNNISLSVPSFDIPFVGTFGGFTINLPNVGTIPLLASGAWNLISDQLAMLHAGEMVVPKNTAESLRNIVSNPAGFAALAPATVGGRGAPLVYIANYSGGEAEDQRLARYIERRVSR